jgi:hypothetical protein
LKARVRELVETGDKLFSKRSSIMTLWQTTAEQFYPERADFTTTRSVGDEFAAHLMTGMPVMARRDLANVFSSMLRPRGRPWFHPRTDNEKVNSIQEAREYLDWMGEVMRRAMYATGSQFVRATKQGDNDFAAFGQCVIEVGLNRELSGLLYRSWHLRDCAWRENAELVVDTLHRNWQLEAGDQVKLFPKTASSTVQNNVSQDPCKEIKCRHIVMPWDSYDLTKEKIGKKFPYVSIVVDIENDVILEEVGKQDLGYVTPRWQTVSGSPYAYSPATVIALPDARLLQRITLTLLEAGEKAVDPPKVAVGEVVQGGVNAFAGGITWIDAEYDERSGEAIRDMQIDSSGLNWGVDREQRIEKMIGDAFYLNQIMLPDVGGEMTAYETQKRVEEYVRRALPLFEPMEVEYNGALCEATFNLLLNNGAFGAFENMPKVLASQDIRWAFESPLQAANERAKTQSFMETANLLKVASEIDPSVRHDINLDRMFRDAVSGTGAPADWLTSEQESADAKEKDRAMQERQQMAGAASQLSELVQQGGVAAQEAAAGVAAVDAVDQAAA